MLGIILFEFIVLPPPPLPDRTMFGADQSPHWSALFLQQRRRADAMNVLDFQKMKSEGRKISMVTCYDYSSARAVAASNIDCILVGDSLAMTMHGYPTTLSATTAMMALHTAAVAKGAPAKFIVADLPFLSYRKGLKDAMDAVHELMSGGAHAVKLEGVRGHVDIIRHIVDSGVPVMGHL